LTPGTQVLPYVRNQKYIHCGLEEIPIGNRKELRKLKRKVEMLEVQVEELGRKIEAQENKKIRIGKIISLTAEILTIIAGIVAIVELFS